MLKRWLVFLSLILLLTGCSPFQAVGDNQLQLPVSSPKPTPTAVVPVANPQTLNIPRLNLTAPIEQVGLTKDKRMGVPTDWFNAGWYNLGPRPGELGSAVIAGHLDTPTGPAIFWNLRQLNPHDLIQVTDEKGKSYQFEITHSATYSDADFPLEQVFAANDGKRLNLITCEGVFNRTNQNYSHRLVVFSKLIE